jgi:hypothetical protein
VVDVTAAAIRKDIEFRRAEVRWADDSKAFAFRLDVDRVEDGLLVPPVVEARLASSTLSATHSRTHQARATETARRSARSLAMCRRPTRRGRGRASKPGRFSRVQDARYRGLVSSQRVPGGVVHKLPEDLRRALAANPAALDAWKDITPLARNEFICWVEDAKQKMTRERRIRRTEEELEEGQRRPCCWPGCSHRERTGRSRVS